MKYLLLFIISILLTNCCFSADKIKIRFLNEKGETILSGKFYLYQFKKGMFKKALFRHHPITNGEIKLDSIPKAGAIGFESDDKYHIKFIWYSDSTKIIKNNEIKIRAKKSGIIKVNMTKKDFSVHEPFVVPYFIHYGGKVLQQGGIGVFLSPGSSFDITELKSGKYHFEIKDSYKKTATVFYKSKTINVIAGKTTVLNDVKLSNLKPTYFKSKIIIPQKKKLGEYFKQNDTTPNEVVFAELKEKFGYNITRVGKYLLDNSNKNYRSKYLLGCFYPCLNQQAKGIKLLEELAKSNYLPAKITLLNVYTSSNPAMYDFQKAIKLAKNIEKESPKNSFKFLGLAHYEKKQFKKAIFFFKKAAKLKSILAFRFLGDIYMSSKVGQKNVKLGEKYLKKAADMKDAIACFNLGKFYLQQGLDKQKAGLYYLEKSASLDNPSANYYLGYFYYTGKFYKKNFKKAFFYYKKSAESYCGPAIITTGRMYLNGIGVKRNIKKAFKYFSAVADLTPEGHIAAASLVIEHLDEIKNTEKNYDRAKNWLKIALKTKQKDYAYYLFGVMHFEGKGFPKNEKKALLMFKKSCKHYNPKVFNAVAYYLAQKGKYLDMALNLIKKVERKNQLNSYSTDTYGYVLLKQKKYKQALTQLLKANKLLPNNPVTLDHLGDVYFVLGKIKEAKKHWTKAVLLVKNDDKLLREIKAKLIKHK